MSDHDPKITAHRCMCRDCGPCGCGKGADGHCATCADRPQTTADRIARAWGLLPDGWNILPPPDPAEPTAEPAFAVIDASGRVDPMSVRRHASTCFVYAGLRRLEDQGPFQVVPVKIVVEGEAVQNV